MNIFDSREIIPRKGHTQLITFHRPLKTIKENTQMGLEFNSARFMLYAKTLGVDFSRSAMIGRQELIIGPSDLKKNLEEFRFSFNEETIQHIYNKDKGYAEEFLRYLGAKDVHSFDISKYEGATHLHDMNQSIPNWLREQYSMVLDGGSLEHVFNFPMAIRNCMEMVQVGGHYLGITPANNFMGHGFYQFSPELFFSIFTPSNGYELVNIIACERERESIWYSVKSPTSVHNRVSLTNTVPVLLLIMAKRVERTSIFELIPMQSDYVTTWKRYQNPLLAFTLRHTPQSVKNLAKRLLGYSISSGLSSGFNPRFFQPIKRTDDTRSK